jgi:hypothetical protein
MLKEVSMLGQESSNYISLRDRSALFLVCIGALTMGYLSYELISSSIFR